MEMSELEQIHAEVKDADFEEAEELTEEDSLRADFMDAISLLSRCQRLLAYMGDPSLVDNPTKKDRSTMLRVSLDLKEFIDGVEGIIE